MQGEFESKIEELTRAKHICEENMKTAIQAQSAAERKSHELQREIDGKDHEIGNLKKELQRREKLTEEKVK